MANLERGTLLIIPMKASFEMPAQHKSKVCGLCYRESMCIPEKENLQGM